MIQFGKENAFFTTKISKFGRLGFSLVSIVIVVSEKRRGFKSIKNAFIFLFKGYGGVTSYFRHYIETKDIKIREELKPNIQPMLFIVQLHCNLIFFFMKISYPVIILNPR